MSVRMRDICGRLRAAAHCFYHPLVIGSALLILFVGSVAIFGARHFLESLSASKREAFLDSVHIGMDEAFAPVLGRLSKTDKMIGEVEIWEEEALRDLGSENEAEHLVFILKREISGISQTRTISKEDGKYLLSDGAPERVLEHSLESKVSFINGSLIRDKLSYIARSIERGNVKLQDGSDWEIKAALIPYDIMELSAPVLSEVASANARITISIDDNSKTQVLAFGDEKKSIFSSIAKDNFDVSIFDANFLVSIISPARVGLGKIERRIEVLIALSALILAAIISSIIVLALAKAEEALNKEKETESKLKLKSEQLKTLLATAPMGVFISTIDGSQFVGNEIFRSLFKLPVGATRFDMWVDALHPEDRDEVKESFLRSCVSGEPFEREFRVLIGGETLFRHMRTSPVTVRGKVSYCIGTVQDITHSKNPIVHEYEERPAERAENSLPSDRVSEALSSIAESVAACHQELKELRNLEPSKPPNIEEEEHATEKPPITIKTRSSVLLAKQENSERAAYPRAVISKVLSLLQLKAEANGIVLGMEIDSRAPTRLDTPPHLLMQSLIEMVDVAISSRKSGSVKVVYSIKGEDPYFSILEEANGDESFGKRSAASFFDTDYPSLNALSESTPTKIIREDHPGKGYITSVSLSGTKATGDIKERDSNGTTVLIVEEREDVREHFEALVRDLGLTPVPAKDTPEAWTKLCSEPFQFVIVDTSLGELPKSLRSTQNGDTIPIIGIKAGSKDRPSDHAFDQMVGEKCTSDELRAALECVAGG